MAKGQAERLLPLIEEMLVSQGASFADLTGIAVGTGPGNFTGIRIAVSLARGLALGLGVPSLGVTGFESVSQAGGLTGPHWAVINAPRGQVYAQRFESLLLSQREPLICDADSEFDAAVLRFSDLSSDEIARSVARVGWLKAKTPQPRPAPFYLRGADASPPSDPPPVILP